MAPLSSKFHISRNFVKIKNKIFQQVIYLAMTAFLCPWQYVLMWFTHMKNVKLNIVSLGALFTKFLTPGLTRQLCNTLDVWLKSTSPTNHPAVYIIRGLTRELKSWWIRHLDWPERRPRTWRCEVLVHLYAQGEGELSPPWRIKIVLGCLRTTLKWDCVILVATWNLTK